MIRLRFKTTEQRLLCTAPFAVLMQVWFLLALLIPGFWDRLDQGNNGEQIFAVLCLVAFAWLFVGWAMTNSLLAAKRKSLFGIPLHHAPSAHDRTILKIVLAITGVIFLVTYAYVTAKTRLTTLQILIAAAMASAVVAYNATLIVWLLSGFKILPGWGKAK